MLSKQEFIDKAKELYPRLEETPFFDMPASKSFHGAYKGGLVQHSYNVYFALSDLTESLILEWMNPDSPFVVALLHDLCKIEMYREVTDEDGTVHYETNKNRRHEGHGESSVAWCKDLGIPLTAEEEECIRYHMGAFTEKEEWNNYSNAVYNFPNVLFTHTADMLASQIMERDEQNAL